jgi:hypothetical protein
MKILPVQVAVGIVVDLVEVVVKVDRRDGRGG